MTPQNKTIVVTGCCSGIGADFAKLARQQGARVIGIDRSAPTLTLDGFVQVDLADPAAIDAAVAQLPAQVHLQSQGIFMGRGVRMNCVSPGAVFTPILGDFVQMLGQERVEKDAHRVKRPAFNDEVAPVIAFLCSDAARWVSGINLAVDGGLASTYI